MLFRKLRGYKVKPPVSCPKPQVVPAPQKAIEKQISKEKLKEISCAFFRWWYNVKGNNTEEGFDEWWEKNKNLY